MNNDSLEDLVGRTVAGRYQLRRLLGEGGFGATFLSEQCFLGTPAREVAVKVSKATGLSEASVRENFSDAFHIVRVFDQLLDSRARTHLVQIFDVGIDESLGRRAYMVSEFVRGESLQDRFATFGGGAPEGIVRGWSIGICTALQALHTMSPPLIHRDVKPDNVLLGLDNQVRLIDFGLAANLVGLGVAAGAAGTPPYMSPETLIGESVTASDVYSVGVMMYEALTGRLPFQDLVPPNWPPQQQNRWIYDQKKKLIPPAVRTKAPLVSARVDDIVGRCLKFDPAERYVNARVLREALEGGDPPPPLLPPWQEILKEGERLALNDVTAAYRYLKEHLDLRRVKAPSDHEARFHLLIGAGEMASQSPSCSQEASDLLKEAWEMLEPRPSLMESPRKRMLLLKLLAGSYAEEDIRRIRFMTLYEDVKKKLDRTQ